MPKVKLEISTEIEFDAQFEIRQGQAVVVVTKTTTTTPVSGRGREWDKRTRRTETQVLNLEDALRLSTSITEAFAHAADAHRPTAHPSDKETYATDATEPHIALMDDAALVTDGVRLELGRYFSLNEAREAAQRLLDASEVASDIALVNVDRQERNGSPWIIELVKKETSK